MCTSNHQGVTQVAGLIGLIMVAAGIWSVFEGGSKHHVIPGDAYRSPDDSVAFFTKENIETDISSTWNFTLSHPYTYGVMIEFEASVDHEFRRKKVALIDVNSTMVNHNFNNKKTYSQNGYHQFTLHSIYWMVSTNLTIFVPQFEMMLFDSFYFAMVVVILVVVMTVIIIIIIIVQYMLVCIHNGIILMMILCLQIVFIQWQLVIVII